MRYILFIAILSTFIKASCSCFEPLEPYCVNSSYTYESQSSFDFCRREVENYSKKWQEFINCNVKCATNKISKTIDRFNCKASGKSYCY